MFDLDPDVIPTLDDLGALVALGLFVATLGLGLIASGVPS